jgi:cupin fold WbuC family metalloprotein
MKTKLFNKEVLYADEPIIKVAHKDIEQLKERLAQNERGRIRLCVHKDIEALIHEMFIIHTRNTYVRPHKHLNKVESMYLIEGEAVVVMFDEAGNILEVIPMGGYSSGRRFYYRISAPYYHTLLINSDFLVFHEVTKGPFKKADTVFASWGPEEHDYNNAKNFMEKLKEDIKAGI